MSSTLLIQHAWPTKDSLEIVWDRPGFNDLSVIMEAGPYHCPTLFYYPVYALSAPVQNPIIKGDSVICSGSSGVYFIDSLPGSTNWNVTGGQIVNGQNTDSVTVLWASPPYTIAARKVTASCSYTGYMTPVLFDDLQLQGDSIGCGSVPASSRVRKMGRTGNLWRSC